MTDKTAARGTDGPVVAMSSHGSATELAVVNGLHGHVQPPVEYSSEGGVAVATLAAAETRNALSPALLDALDAALAVAVEEGARALVITGSGRTFCAGGDLAGLAAVLDGDVEIEVGVMVDRLHHVIATLRTLPMPTVAAVNGGAVGAGVSLAMAADVRVVARSASFVAGYLAVNATPDGGASYHLSRALGSPQAASSLLLNRRFTADELLRNGLADRLADDGEVLSVAREVARDLARLSFSAVRSVRELVDRAPTHSLAEHLEAERSHFLRAAQSPELRDAVAPFARPDITVVRA
jgi:2-(1,2-epoxy-1,2-dihydrophenyl)acetyl-CoA isomerase